MTALSPMWPFACYDAHRLMSSDRQSPSSCGGAVEHRSSNREDTAGAARAGCTDRAISDATTSWAPTLARCARVQSSAMETTLTCSTGTSCRQLAWARNIGCGDNIVWGSTVDYNLTTWHLRRQPQMVPLTTPTSLGTRTSSGATWCSGPVTWFNLSATSSVARITSRRSRCESSAPYRKLCYDRLLCQEQYIDQTVWSIVESGL
jgi:hypothetical protein